MGRLDGLALKEVFLFNVDLIMIMDVFTRSSKNNISYYQYYTYILSDLITDPK